MYMQMNDLVTLSKLTQEGRDDIEIPERNKVRGRSTIVHAQKSKARKGAKLIRFQKLQTSKPN